MKFIWMKITAGILHLKRKSLDLSSESHPPTVFQAFLAMTAFNYHYFILNMLFQPDRTDKQLWFIWDLDAEFDLGLSVRIFSSLIFRSTQSISQCCLVGGFQTLPKKWRQSLVRWEAQSGWTLQGGKGHQHQKNAKKAAKPEAETSLSGREWHYLFQESTTIFVFLIWS